MERVPERGPVARTDSDIILDVWHHVTRSWRLRRTQGETFIEVKERGETAWRKPGADLSQNAGDAALMRLLAYVEIRCFGSRAEIGRGPERGFEIEARGDSEFIPENACSPPAP